MRFVSRDLIDGFIPSASTNEKNEKDNSLE